MRIFAFTPLMAALLVVSAVLAAGGLAHAGTQTLADQVAAVLYEESARGKIRVTILDFNVSAAPGEATPSEKEAKELGARFTDEFTADIMNKMKEAGKRENVAVIDRSALSDILRERKASATESAERTALEIGRSAGIDVIVIGSLQRAGDAMTATAKVIRVKDGEILDIVKQDRPGKTSPSAQAPVALLETVEKIEIGSYKAFPLHLPSGGTVSVTVDVLRGNPVDVTVIPASELEHFKEQKEFKKTVILTAAKKKRYSRSAELANGDYYLIVRDSSLGVFAVQNSAIKVQVTLSP